MVEEEEQALVFSPVFPPGRSRQGRQAGLPAGSTSMELLGRGSGSSSSFLSAPIQRELLVELLTKT